MGKSHSAKQKTVADFSFCRDLQGRRLGPANTALKLEKLKEGEQGVRADTWLLQQPSWSEPDRRKKVKKTDDERKKKYVSKAASAAAASASTRTPPGDSGFSLDFAREREQADKHVLDAVLAGLSRAKKNTDRDGGNDQDDESNSDEMEDDEGQELTGSLIAPPGVSVQSGKARFAKTGEVFVVTGASEFCTVVFPMPRSGYQVKALTDGLVQIGMLDPACVTGANNASQDGVGDFAGSWSFDGARGIMWAEGQAVALKVCFLLQFFVKCC